MYGLVDVNTTPPYQYGLAPIDSVVTPTVSVHTELGELVPTSSYGDGVAWDTGNHRALARSINNLQDHKTAHQSPGLVGTLTNTLGGGVYQLVYMRKVFFGIQRFGAGFGFGYLSRSASAKIWFRSSSGAAVNARITLAANRITDAYLTEVSATAAGYQWVAPFSQGVVTTPATTAWGTSTEVLLDLRCLDGEGCAWVAIELAAACETKGFAQLIERERT